MVAASNLKRCAGPLVIATAALSMFVWSWGKWPDVLIDFGRDLYIPWQLASGKALYVDVQHVLGGPLSQYLNSFWFRMFGPSLRTLVGCNAVIVAATLALLYAVSREIGDRFAATVACLAVVFIFAFGQLDAVGNYNYICPYRHEVTHGLFFSLAALYCLSRYQRASRPGWTLAAAFCLGLAFLTKTEMFVAASVSTVTGFAFALWLENPDRLRLAKTVAGLLVASALPFLVALGLLSRAMPAHQALAGIVGQWKTLESAAYIRSDFQLQVMGLDDVGQNLRALLWSSAGHGALFLTAVLVSFAVSKLERARRIAPFLLFILAAALLALAPISWPDVMRPLPVVMTGSIVALGVLVLRGRSTPDLEARRNVLRLSIALFATTLLGKFLLNVHVSHYGFALAMPATVLFIVLLLAWVPTVLKRRGADARTFQSIALAAICVAIGVHLQATSFWWSKKTHPVAQGSDSFLADDRGVAVDAALSEIVARTKQEETLAVFPEGHMLNYLSRRRNPNPFIDFMPTELSYFGEEVILEAFRAAPPDWIALVHKDTSEYGPTFFGRDYGRKIGDWIRSEYKAVKLFGSVPLRTSRFGILLLQRRRSD